MKTFFPWVGGKTQTLKKYKDGFKDKRYTQVVDVFSGAGVMSLYFRRLYPDAKIIMADYNKELTTLYTCLQKEPEAFKKELENLTSDFCGGKNPCNAYKTAPDVFRNGFYNSLRNTYIRFNDRLTDVEKSAMLYLMLRTCNNGYWQPIKSLNPALFGTPFAFKPRGFNYQPVDWELISQYEVLLSTPVSILNGDFEDVLSSVEFCENTLVYLDPPYEGCGNVYSEGGWSTSDTERLIKWMNDNVDSCDIAMSNMNRDIFHKTLDKKFSICSIEDVHRSAGNNTGKNTEVFVTNYII